MNNLEIAFNNASNSLSILTEELLQYEKVAPSLFKRRVSCMSASERMQIAKSLIEFETKIRDEVNNSNT